MNALQHLLRAWREAITSHNYDLVADTEEGWTNADALKFQDFMTGTTGRRLKARLTNYVIRSAVEATRQPSNHAYHNGVARGIALSVNALDQHLIASPVRNTDTEDSEQPSVAQELALN